MTGPDNAVVGDENYGTELPRMKPREEDLREEKNRAAFSRTEEFKKLKEHMESRIEFYQKWLPNGESVIGSQGGQMKQSKEFTNEQLGENWKVASILIGELQNIILAYESAHEAVKNATTRRAN